MFVEGSFQRMIENSWFWLLTVCQACELGSYIFRLQVLLVTYRWYSDIVAATRFLHDVAKETAGIGWRKFGSVSVTSGSGCSISPVRPSLGPDWPFWMDPLSFSSCHSLKPKDKSGILKQDTWKSGKSKKLSIIAFYGINDCTPWQQYQLLSIRGLPRTQLMSDVHGLMAFARANRHTIG